MKSSIILIRHGQSLGNADPSYYKHPDVCNILSKYGVDQCVALSKNIHTYLHDDYHMVHTTVLCSAYQRAKLTAQIVMNGINLPIIYDNRLNESYHTNDHESIESDESIIRRMKSLLASYEFNLICFTHGLFMRQLDPQKPPVKNAEVRKYDREDFIKMLNGKIIV